MAFLHHLLSHDDEEYSELSARLYYDQMQYGKVLVAHGDDQC